MCAREKESVPDCMWEREKRESMFVCVTAFMGEREIECVSVTCLYIREREWVSVCIKET